MLRDKPPPKGNCHATCVTYKFHPLNYQRARIENGCSSLTFSRIKHTPQRIQPNIPAANDHHRALANQQFLALE